MSSLLKYFSRACLCSTIIWQLACQAQPPSSTGVWTGADQMDLVISQLKDKSVALLVNHTSTIGETHLLDTLLASGIEVKTIFAPEHGFRGNQANGEKVPDGKDPKTGLPIISLYGKNFKPKASQLKGIDAVVYDIQDVGVRFYTYISSMHYMMEACAENQIEFVLLDRPNPNAHYIDGPVLEEAHASFVGVHPIPIVYGMTAGELAQMIIGEQWINAAEALSLTVVPLKNWQRDSIYQLPIQPSPNLPNDQAIALYPSLGLFEGTDISVGRGTLFPFQVVGYIYPEFGTFEFIPRSMPSASKYPKHENRVCYGYDLREESTPKYQLDLSWLIRFYQLYPDQDDYFNPFFINLSGTRKLGAQIENGFTEEEIRASWQEGLAAFKLKREKYLIYP